VPLAVPWSWHTPSPFFAIVMVEADAAEAEPPVSYVSICGLGHLALVALTCAPLLVRVEPNVNIVTTATLAVYVGCCRSLKKVRQVEAMTQGDAMKCVALSPSRDRCESGERPVGERWIGKPHRIGRERRRACMVYRLRELVVRSPVRTAPRPRSPGVGAGDNTSVAMPAAPVHTPTGRARWLWGLHPPVRALQR